MVAIGDEHLIPNISFIEIYFILSQETTILVLKINFFVMLLLICNVLRYSWHL